ncbi:MAG: MFS transporter [Candidatus Methanomethylicaceae archaeon]|jgi:MFS family permease
MQDTSGESNGHLKGIPRNVLLMIIALSVNGFGIGYLFIYIPAYLPQIGVPSATVGLLLGVEGLTMAIMAIPFGMLSDRKGRKRLLIIGSFGPVPMFFVFALTIDPVAMTLAAALGGIFEGIYLATVNALIADQTALKYRDTAFTLSFIVGGTGMALGTALPFFIPELSGILGINSAALHTDLLYLLGFISLLIPFALYFILKGVKETIRPATIPWRGKSIRTLLKFSGINAIIGLGAGFIIPLIPTWLLYKFAIPDSISGPILAISTTTIGLAAAFSPMLARKIGTVRAVVLTQGLSLAFMVALAFVGNFITAAVIYVIRTGLMNMAQPLLDSYLMGIVDKDQRGFASSLNSVIWRVPNSVTTIAGGIILGSGNYDLPFLLAGGCYIVGISLFYATFRNIKPSE